jgi:hypothetical protein
MKAREVEEFQFALQNQARLLTGIGIKAIPFVYRNHQCTSRLDDEVSNVRILIRDISLGINHQNNDVGVFNCFQGFNHREFFDGLKDLTALAHASRINQHIFLATTLKINLDRVTGCAWLVECDNSLFTQQSVDHG